MADPPEEAGSSIWGDLEDQFFAAAPPDAPEEPPELLSFEDLIPAEPPPTRAPMGLRVRAAASAGRAALQRRFRQTASLARLAMNRVALSPMKKRQGVTVALGSLILVAGVSVGVVAFGNATEPTSRQGSPGPASGVVGSAQKAPDGHLEAPGSSSVLAPAPRPGSAAPEVGAGELANATVAHRASASGPTRRTRPRLDRRDGAQAKGAPTHHRRLASAPSSARDLMVPSFVEHPAAPKAPTAPLPVPTQRPFFSR